MSNPAMQLRVPRPMWIAIPRGSQLPSCGLTVEYLDISGTRLTGAGVAELQRALPKLKIER